MPIEKQKLNTLNKLIDHGVNTEKKITAMGIQEIIAVPKITVPEIHIITELQDAIKTRSTIAYLAAAEDEDKKEKKRHFKSDKKQDKLKEQLAELNDKVVRQMAEFDNYRKRTEKEKQAMFETGARSVIEKLLPIVDNFERGLAGLKEGEEHTAFEEGMLMVYKQLMTELEKLEVKPLDAAGKEFDPNLHNAVMHVDDESLGENIVVEELQKGYTYRDTVVRHSMVKVAN